MKNYTLLISVFLITIYSFGQSAVEQDSSIKLIQTDLKYVSGPDARSILSQGTEWESFASYDVLKDSITIYPEPYNIKVLSKNRVNYVTSKDRLTFKKSNIFKINYGGRGPEKQTFEIKYYDDQCLILESSIMIGTKANHEKRTIRYLWRKK